MERVEVGSEERSHDEEGDRVVGRREEVVEHCWDKEERIGALRLGVYDDGTMTDLRGHKSPWPSSRDPI